MPVDKVHKGILQICHFCGASAKLTKAIPSSSLQGQYYVALVKELADQMFRYFDEQLKGYQVVYSKGMSVIPRVPWVAIVPKGYTVGNKPSVTICFGRRGEGVVAGLMIGKRTPVSALIPQIRNDIKVNVNGSKPETSYNNAFVNPREFLLPEFDVTDLLQHIKISFDILKSI